MTDGWWLIAYGLWLMADGVWPMAYGRWPMAYGVWRTRCMHLAARARSDRGEATGDRLAAAACLEELVTQRVPVEVRRTAALRRLEHFGVELPQLVARKVDVLQG